MIKGTLNILLPFLISCVLQASTHVSESLANRLTYLSEGDPFHPHLDFPKLTTPQWVGDMGVEAVVTLGIDDMRGPERYESFLRPVLDRLKEIDGRAPVSIMTNSFKPDHPQAQTWLQEGLSIEVHTLTHPCPLLQQGNFRRAAEVVHGGLDLLAGIPGNHPIAYRMPCCDSMNSLSPRFFAEIFNKTSSAGRYLQIDTSVFNITTSRDKSLPSKLVLDANGKERFAKYLPKEKTRAGMRTMASYVGTIEDYPYPYVINRLCWEFPCVVPSDWEAHNLIGDRQPQMLEDWKRALDVTVLKQGVMNLVFHPHGWSSSSQLVEFVDYAQKTYGKKVKFLNFRECIERLNQNLLKGSSLRGKNGQDNGVRVLDANNDGFMDVLIGEQNRTRIWNPKQSSWTEHKLPFNPMQNIAGVLEESGAVSMMDAKGNGQIWTFKENGWRFVQSNALKQSVETPSVLKEIHQLIATTKPALDRITKNEGEKSDWFDLTGTMTTRHLIRQLGKEKVLNWESPLVAANPDKPITLCLTGGLGFESQPGTAGFMLAVDGKDALRFDLSRKFSRWQSKDDSVEVIYHPTWITDLDSGGYFFFILKKGTVKKKRSISFSVRSLGAGSRRWFAIDAKQNVVENLKKLSAQIGKPNENVGILRDIDNDGVCELVGKSVYGWDAKKKSWNVRGYGLPDGINHASEGLRFVDLNDDGFDDIVFSDEEHWGIHLWATHLNAGLGWHPGWSYTVREGKRNDTNAIPMISCGGFNPNNGAWFHSGHLWVQNENTANLPDVVDRRSFKQLLDFGGPGAKEPEESRQCFKTRDGFEVQLVASEPQVLDPVAFDWGADGKLWVTEMGDYPSGINGKGKPGGIVRFLEDRNDDGRYDHSTVFLSGLNFPSGVMAWGKGVLVSAAPDILYAEDTDGNGKADLRKVLFTGFREGNQQHRMNGFVLGLDNWIYAANGDSGGMIKSTATGKVVNINGRDFRFKVTGEMQTLFNQTQFGLHRDDWGNWFGNNNPNWLWHIHLPLHYVTRNPHLVVKDTRQMLFNYPDSRRCFPISPRMERPNMPGAYGMVTSANSPSPYRGGLFGPDFEHSVFISEPVHNLIHREVLAPDGITFTSNRAKGEEKSEFLASSDNWFRPTMTKTGPDGALYVADMYRLVIEHPKWIPPGMQSRVNLREGSNRGRIWRVLPKGFKLRKTPRLDRMSTKTLVTALDSPNGWQRDTIQRLLLARGAEDASADLRKLAQTSMSPKVRLQALCILEGLESLDSKVLKQALEDPHFSVREQAVRLCEENHADLIVSRIEDESIRVRRQVAFSLGEWQNTEAGKALVRLALADANEPRVQLAVKSSALPHAATMLKHIFLEETKAPTGLLSDLIRFAILKDNLEPLAKVFDEIAAEKDLRRQFILMDGFVDAIEQRNEPLDQFHQRLAKASERGIRGFETVFAKVRAIARDDQADESARLSAIALLGRGPTDQREDINLLGNLLAAGNRPSIRKAALNTLPKLHQPLTASVLLTHWNSYAPVDRVAVAEHLLGRDESAHALLDSIEAGKLSAVQISPAHRQKLLQYPRPAISTRAKKLLGGINPDRAKVIQRYAGVSDLKGSVKNGKLLFTTNCSVCHSFKGQGNKVGPDLATFSVKPINDWLIGILDPNQAVETTYTTYLVISKDDSAITGVLASETPSALILRTASGQEVTVLRKNLKSIQAIGQSLMPEGLETALNPEAVADLLAYLRTP